MKRETFITCLQALLSEADDELLREAEGLVFWRRRELRAAEVAKMEPGQYIIYTQKDGTQAGGTIHKLNKFSVTVHKSDAHTGYIPLVIAVERIVGVYSSRLHYTDQTPLEKRVPV